MSEKSKEDGPGPNLRRRELGRQLRLLRRKAGRKSKETAEYTGLTDTTIIRIEGGKQTILPRNVRLMCQFYEVGAPLADTLVRQAEESNERGWWAMYSDNMPDWFEKFVGLESDADKLCYYSPLLVDGQLQTPEYAQAIFSVKGSACGVEGIEKAVELRQARQRCLHRPHNPADLHVILDEGAVRRLVGGPEVMRKQLDYLAEMGQKPNITVQVMPFAAGAHCGLHSPFRLIRFPDGYDDMDTVYVENQRGAVWLERPSDIKHYTGVFEQLTSSALSPADSADFVVSVAASL